MAGRLEAHRPSATHRPRRRRRHHARRHRRRRGGARHPGLRRRAKPCRCSARPRSTPQRSRPASPTAARLRPTPARCAPSASTSTRSTSTRSSRPASVAFYRLDTGERATRRTRSRRSEQRRSSSSSRSVLGHYVAAGLSDGRVALMQVRFVPRTTDQSLKDVVARSSRTCGRRRSTQAGAAGPPGVVHRAGRAAVRRRPGRRRRDRATGGPTPTGAEHRAHAARRRAAPDHARPGRPQRHAARRHRPRARLSLGARATERWR